MLLFGVPALVLAIVAIGAGYLLSLPGVEDAGARVRAILVAHGGTFEPGPPPIRLADAAVATEDEHFYSNVAVNIADGAGRAALATLQGGGDPGGSTIDQQLAKLLYPHGGGLFGTLEEIGLAVKLSLNYSNSALLSMYLNAAYFGNGYWGESAAAHGYFGSSPQQLSWADATMLAGLLQAPSAYDPVRHPQAARERQGEVVDQLVDNHYISARRGQAVLAEPLFRYLDEPSEPRRSQSPARCMRKRPQSPPRGRGCSGPG